MRIFFAGVNKDRSALLTGLGVKNFLASYENPKATEYGAEGLKTAYPGNSMILDSGAFSAWNSGRVINLQEYIEYARDFVARHQAGISYIYVVNLDVIPGRQGEIPTSRQVEEASEAGWANMLEMEKAGLTPVHIFHQGEDFSWLDRIAKRHRYIGISPSNDAGLKSKRLWLTKVYSIIRANNMTHGFAVTAKELMRAFPWYSVDSTSWLAPQVWGKTVFTKSFEEMRLSSRCKSHVEYVMAENVKSVLRIQRKITQLWRVRGVIWDEDEPDRPGIGGCHVGDGLWSV